MLNTNNYFSKAASINWDSLPEALTKGHKLVEGASQNNWAAYNSNENIKRVVDAYFQKLTEYLGKNPSSVVATSKSLPTKTVKSSPKPAAAKPATRYMPPKKAAVEKEQYDSEDVELIDTDVQFIKRYAAMHGKVKSQAQILTLLHSLQKAIIERRIGKDSPYAKEIDMMQKQLISCYEKMGDMAEIKIDSKNLKRYLEIAHSQEGMFSVALLKSYIALNGKKDVKDRSQRLFNRIKKAVEQGKITKSDKYADKLNEAYQTLKNYIDGDSAMLNINKAQLNGLMGILGENLFHQKKSLSGYDDDNGMIVSSGELLAMDFQTIGLQGRYKELIGDPSVGFTAMVYGLPKSGKSTMCLDFANYLAANHGKVLYCAIEEGFGYTLKEKIERLKAHHSNLYITDRVPENLNDFNFVFIDSVSKAGMDVNDIDALRKMHPEVSFIFIYHTTKEGKFKGVNEHAHEVDVIVQVEKGKATSTGRFNAGGVMEI
ncbi:AAA family ATPase [Flavobacterium sp.]|uniref:AAA family ATPase n=1 Tax=Flavobacterium sp. TaxID=239 RepID=UPI0025DFF8B3|nr:AAA family ATPase [Flavobacterium sp.]